MVTAKTIFAVEIATIINHKYANNRLLGFKKPAF
jgi:hypothetical protein